MSKNKSVILLQAYFELDEKLSNLLRKEKSARSKLKEAEFLRDSCPTIYEVAKNEYAKIKESLVSCKKKYKQLEKELIIKTFE